MKKINKIGVGILMGSFLVLLGCSNSNTTTEPGLELLEQTYFVKNLRNASAIAVDCLKGGTGKLSSDQEQTDSPITITFLTIDSYKLTIDGDPLTPNSWEALDDSTISLEINTGSLSSGSPEKTNLDLAYSINSLTDVMTVLVTDDWQKENCATE